jgi:heme A synthase
VVAAHVVVGSAVILLNLAAGALGGLAWFRRRPSIPFWYLLRGAQAAVFLQALLGGLLVVTGHEPDESLHYLYGGLPLLVSFLAEGARAGAAEREVRGLDVAALSEEERRELAMAIVRREMGTMAVSCGVILFLALRALTTGGI